MAARLGAAATVALALVGASNPAWAGCETYPTVNEEFATSEFILIGRVTSARLDWSPSDPGEFDGIRYTVQPLKVFKGEPPAELPLYSENTSGRFPMMVAGWYMIFVAPNPQVEGGDPVQWSISNCGHSFALLDVPKAFENPPIWMTFEEIMALESYGR